MRSLLFSPRFSATRLALPICLLLVCSAAHAQWTWRDKDGRVTASDLPPPREIAEKDILSRPAPRTVSRAVARAASAPVSSAAAAAAASLPATRAAAPVDRELEARKKAAESDQAAKVKAEEDKLAAHRADNCRRARAQMTALESGQRMSRVNDKGEREVLDDKARAEEMRRAREVATADCR